MPKKLKVSSLIGAALQGSFILNLQKRIPLGVHSIVVSVSGTATPSATPTVKITGTVIKTPTSTKSPTVSATTTNIPAATNTPIVSVTQTIPPPPSGGGAELPRVYIDTTYAPPTGGRKVTVSAVEVIFKRL